VYIIEDRDIIKNTDIEKQKQRGQIEESKQRRKHIRPKYMQATKIVPPLIYTGFYKTYKIDMKEKKYNKT
jgi:hypothetical protein